MTSKTLSFSKVGKWANTTLFAQFAQQVGKWANIGQIPPLFAWANTPGQISPPIKGGGLFAQRVHCPNPSLFEK